MDRYRWSGICDLYLKIKYTFYEIFIGYIRMYYFPSRCDRGNKTIEYILDHVSPNAANYCPRKSDTQITFNEVHLTDSSQVYIELFDMGKGNTVMSK